MKTATLKKAAKLIMAIHGRDFLDNLMPQDVGLPETDFEKLRKCFEDITNRMSGDMPMNFGSAKQVIDYFKNSES